MGETNASVSCCAFDDSAPWLEQASLLGSLDDKESGAVFYTAAGVLEFCFAEDVAARFFGELLEADEGRVTDGWGSVSMACRACLAGNMVPSRKPRCPMPWALEMFIAVAYPASDAMLTWALRSAETAKLRAAVLSMFPACCTGKDFQQM